MSLAGLEISYRPMTAQEIEYHAKEIRPLGWRHSVERSFFGFVVTLIPLAVFFDHFPTMKHVELPTLVLFFAMWVWFCILYARNPVNSSFRVRHLQELADGRIEISRYHTVAAIKVEELEDEGSNYFILLGDDTVVYISGQFLYDAEEASLFPCTEFVVERTAAMKESRGFSPLGSSLPIVITLPPYPENALGTPQVPFDGDLIPISWHQLLGGHKLLREVAE
jgi:hypothetical protein